MEHDIRIIKGERLGKELKALAKDQPHKMYRMLQWCVIRGMELTIKNLDGKVLRRITGNLMGSIRGYVWWKGEDVGAEIYSTCVYSATHELGLTIHNAWGRGIVFTMPKRPFMGPAVKIAVDDTLEKLANDWWKL